MTDSHGICVDCGEHTFRINGRGFHPKRCVPCKKVYNSERVRRNKARWYAANADKAREQGRVWYENNTDRAKQSQKAWRKLNPDAWKACVKKQKTIRRGVERASAQTIRSVDIFDRDGWMCWLCIRPIDSSLKYPNQMSASLDHVTPISQGGEHVSENLRAAHWICNTMRGAREPKELAA